MKRFSKLFIQSLSKVKSDIIPNRYHSSGIFSESQKDIFAKIIIR
jgi:hypothetical protein